MLPDVIAGRHDIHPRIEELLERVRINPFPARRIFTVGDGDVDTAARAKAPKLAANKPACPFANDITKKEHAHGSTRVMG
jgi:hypothetical protein